MRVIHLKWQIHCCLIKSNRFSLNFSACIGTLTTRSALIHGLDCFASGSPTFFPQPRFQNSIGARLVKKSSTPGLSSRSAAQAQLVSSGSVGPCGLGLPTLVGYQPLLLEERFPITCAPPLVQAPAFYRSYLSVVEVREDPEV